MRTIGLLGGSFDPVHSAHLAMADAFATALDLDELRFLPASRPWQKEALQASDAERLAMLRTALATHRPSRGDFVVDTRELERAGRTYTIDTLRALRAELGDAASLVFLVGADQLARLDTWREWRSLWDCAHLAAISRPGFAFDAVPDAVATEWKARAATVDAIHARPCGGSFVVAGFAMDVSATAIRAAFAEPDGDDVPGLDRLVPAEVLAYIRTHSLYKN